MIAPRFALVTNPSDQPGDIVVVVYSGHAEQPPPPTILGPGESATLELPTRVASLMVSWPGEEA